ncbi:MAG: class I SAM-dependent methyltransferase [Halodesulfurarchaeum sp.]
MNLDPFETETETYEAWFDRFEAAYRAEIRALEELLEPTDRTISIGVGTARFAEPLGVPHGVDPSPAMLERARERGIEAVQGVGEALPYRDGSADSLLSVTTVCFFEDLDRAIEEAARVLEPGGTLLLGFIDRESQIGQQYQAIKDENPFYRHATFYSTAELKAALDRAGFEAFETRQTLFSMPEELAGPDPVREGTGEGSFVALRARLPRSPRSTSS